MTEQTPVPAAADGRPDGSYGLKHQVLSPLEVLGQSVANIAPTGTPTVVVPPPRVAYFCQTSQQYYPVVPVCDVPWMMVNY